jgi:hypothetical protein
LGEGVGDDSYYTDKNNRFERNRYRIDSRSRAFMWQKQELTLEEWQAYGHDDGQSGN